MSKVATAQAKVAVGIEALWRALAKDLGVLLPKIMPNLVTSVEVIEGDGEIGSVLLLHMGPDVTIVRTQKEKIVELDESVHQFGLQLLEGVLLKMGFSSFKTTFQLNVTGEQETLVNIKVVYESETEESSSLMEMATKPGLNFIECLAKYLLSCAS